MVALELLEGDHAAQVKSVFAVVRVPDYAVGVLFQTLRHEITPFDSRTVRSAV